MMKKVTSRLSLILVLLCLMVTSTFAASPESDFEFSNGKITKYMGLSADVVIPSTINGEAVTKIGSNAFYWSKETLHSVVVPEGVISIEDSVFYGCKNLVSVDLPESLLFIGSHAFDQCTNLTNVQLPSQLQVLKNSAFRNTGITSVTIPTGITNVLQYCFYGCQNLTQVNLHENVTTIGSRAFSNTPWFEQLSGEFVVVADGVLIKYGGTGGAVTIPSSVKYIGGGSFTNNETITSIYAPYSVTEISSDCFAYCTNLQSVVFGDSLEIVGGSAFLNCENLVSVDFGNGLLFVGMWAFRDCVKLETVNFGHSFAGFAEENKDYQYEGGFHFSARNLIFDNCISLKELVFPETFEFIVPMTLDGSNVIENGLPSLEKITFYGNAEVSSDWYHYTTDPDGEISGRGVGTERPLDEFMNDPSNVVIERSLKTVAPNVTIYAYTNSPAHQHAEEYNIPFVSLGTVADTTTPETSMPETTTPETSTPETTMPETSTPSESSLIYDPWASTIVSNSQSNNLLVESLGSDYTKSITRVQIAELLVNMIENSCNTTLDFASSSTFTDTTNLSVLKAYESGILTGKGNQIFDPNGLASRNEIAVMIYNSIQTMEKITNKSMIYHGNTTITGYNDADSVEIWAKNAMGILINNEIMGGTSATTISPTSDTSIQECLVLNQNLFFLIG